MTIFTTLKEMAKTNFACNPDQRQVDSYKKHESIRDYTDDELYAELEKAEELPNTVLAVICAEILRRQRTRNE